MDEVLARLAREHSGVVARADALAAGMTYDGFEGLTASGLYVRTGLRTVRAVTTPVTFDSRLWTGRLEVGGDLYVTGEAAAALLGVARVREPALIEAMVASTRRPRPVEGFRLVRAMPGDLLGSRTVHGHLVTPLEVTLRQLARVRTHGQMVTILTDELRKRTTTCHRLRSVTGRGREGSARLRQALLVAGDGAHARAERRFAAEVRRRGVALATQVNLRCSTGASYWLDGLVRSVRLGYEIEGPEHLDPRQHDYDCRRANQVLTEHRIDLMPFSIAYVDRDLAGAVDDFVREVAARTRELAG